MREVDIECVRSGDGINECDVVDKNFNADCSMLGVFFFGVAEYEEAENAGEDCMDISADSWCKIVCSVILSCFEVAGNNVESETLPCFPCTSMNWDWNSDIDCVVNLWVMMLGDVDSEEVSLLRCMFIDEGEALWMVMLGDVFSDDVVYNIKDIN